MARGNAEFFSVASRPCAAAHGRRYGPSPPEYDQYAMIGLAMPIQSGHRFLAQHAGQLLRGEPPARLLHGIDSDARKDEADGSPARTCVPDTRCSQWPSTSSHSRSQPAHRRDSGNTCLMKAGKASQVASLPSKSSNAN
jgi:hypothetical protein